MEFLAICSFVCIIVGLIAFNLYQRRIKQGVGKKALDAFVIFNGFIVTGTTLAIISLGWFFMK